MQRLDGELGLGGDARGAGEDRVERADGLAGMARARGHDHLAEELAAEDDVVRGGIAFVRDAEAARAGGLDVQQRERIVRG